MKDDKAYLEPRLSQNSLFKHFQRHLCIFRDTDKYLATLTGAQLWWRVEASLDLFKNQKNYPDFLKERPQLCPFLS